MDIVSTKAELQTQKAKDFFARLYGKETVPVQLQRYLSVVECFEKDFSEKDILLFS